MNGTAEEDASTEVELSAARGLAADTLGFLPRLIVGALEDLHSIAQSARVLPEIAQSLTSIEASVDSMDREVKLMRRGVDRLDDDVMQVVDGVEPLDAKLEDLRRTLHPLSRATSLLGRRGRSEEEPDKD